MRELLFTPENITQAQVFAREGKTSRQIATNMGISKTLAHRLVSVGKPRSFPSLYKKGFTEEDIVTLYTKERLNTFEIQQRIGVNHETIRVLLHQRGVLKQSPKKVAPARLAQKVKTMKCHSAGYILIRREEHPKADKNGFVYEHLLVWEHVHNRPLPKGWAIHHLNGVKTDNRPENLIGLPSKKHLQYIPVLKKRIRELESKNDQLEQALRSRQMLFIIGEN